MKTVFERKDCLYEINKSKFYGIMIHLEDPSLVKDTLSLIKKEYPKANHYCYGYIINEFNKSNDDGEPSGTAGRPILEFLKNNDLHNVLCVVVRYFGGIKLGAGGLIRAYVEASKRVLSLCDIVDVIDQNLYKIEINYSLFNIVNSFLSAISGNINNVSYEEKIIITFSSNENFIDDLINLTNGNVKIDLLGKEKVNIDVE